MVLRVRYVRDILPLSKSGDWIDLRCAEDVTMTQGEYKLLPLGIAIELPRGYEALVVPRSSTYKHFGIILVNSIGVIDEDYCGDDDEWHFPALAMRDTIIHKNERIAQFRIIEHMPNVYIRAVQSLGNVNRGGIGSTGRV